MALIIWLLGIAGMAGGGFMLLYDGIGYLQTGAWKTTTSFAPFAGVGWFDNLPQVQSGLEAVPLWIGLFVVGLILFSLGTRLKHRYE